MFIKNIIEEDFTNYKECGMFIGFPTCTFKCEKECGCFGMCQNSSLAQASDIETTPHNLVNRYMNNMISRVIVCGGLEPLDSFTDVIQLLAEMRSQTDDMFIVYTGYTKEEVASMMDDNSNNSYLDRLKAFSNVIIKFGRYIPNQEKHYDDVLGIYLASDNQYAEKIS